MVSLASRYTITQGNTPEPTDATVILVLSHYLSLFINRQYLLSFGNELFTTFYHYIDLCIDGAIRAHYYVELLILLSNVWPVFGHKNLPKRPFLQTNPRDRTLGSSIWIRARNSRPLHFPQHTRGAQRLYVRAYTTRGTLAESIRRLTCPCII